MNLFKKICLTVLLILFIISIFKDLTVGTIIQDVIPKEEKPIPAQEDSSKNPDSTVNYKHPQETDRYQVESYTTAPGDTVLTIVEALNNDQQAIQMDQIIQDFQILNPEADPHQIKPNTDYLFPLYKNLP
ncbi:hypothetical protein [Aquibacillus saliphilus]|uniref:hypothetical protein n=1 Tax=Aquibacillus saliphilus TaxID=1909422 RepID=UPI001CF082B8|nr:hypothetical protein [Aquibacillus saliphilus]